MVIASVEYRTANESLFPSQVEDIKSAIRFLKARAEFFGIDPNRIGIMGESAGGHLAALVGTSNGVSKFERGENLEYGSEVKSVCAWYPPVDLQLTGSDVDGKDPFHGNPPQNLLLGINLQLHPEQAEDANPKSYLRRDCPPFLLLHGDLDKVVPVSHSIGLYEAIEQNGTPVELHILRGAGHGSSEFFQAKVQGIIINFFLKTFGMKSEI